MYHLLPLIFAAVLTNVGAHLSLKKGVSLLGEVKFSSLDFAALIPKVFQNIWLASGLSLFVISFILYLFVLSKVQLNILYPVLVGSGIILITLSSWSFFKETLSMTQIMGILIIILGIFLVMPKNTL